MTKKETPIKEDCSPECCEAAPSVDINYHHAGELSYAILYQAFRDEDGNVKTSKLLIPQGQELGIKFVGKAIGFPAGYSIFVSDAIGEVVVQGEPETILATVSQIKHRDYLPANNTPGFRKYD